MLPRVRTKTLSRDIPYTEMKDVVRWQMGIFYMEVFCAYDIPSIAYRRYHLEA